MSLRLMVRESMWGVLSWDGLRDMETVSGSRVSESVLQGRSGRGCNEAQAVV